MMLTMCRRLLGDRVMTPDKFRRRDTAPGQLGATLRHRFHGHSFKIERQLTFSRALNIRTQSLLVWREDHDALSTPRNRNIPLLRTRGGTSAGVGENHLVDRLPLRAVGRDGVASQKHSLLWRERFPGTMAAFDYDSTVFFHRANGHKLTII